MRVAVRSAHALRIRTSAVHSISALQTCGIDSLAAVLLELPVRAALLSSALRGPLPRRVIIRSRIRVRTAARVAARHRRAARHTPAMGLVHERLLNATYWKEIIGDAPEEGVDPLILKLFAGVMLLWVLFGPCLTYAVELSGRRRKRLKID